MFPNSSPATSTGAGKPSFCILFADDEPDTQRLVARVLNSARMQVMFADNGYQALEIWRKHSLDLVILDIMMPVMDGVETCRHIRRSSDIPIILLTAKGREQDVVDGFEAGADDYIVKPFRPRELVARINAILQRSKRQQALAKQYAFDDLALDLEALSVTYRGQNIQVTPLEIRLLQYLMQHAGLVLSKEELLQNVWGYVEPVDEMNLIEAAIRRLRKKIEIDPSQPHYIQTVRGAGYRFAV